MTEKPNSPVFAGIDDGFMETKIVLIASGRMVRIPSQIRSGEHNQINLSGAKTAVEGYTTDAGAFVVGDIDTSDTTRQDDYPTSPANRVLVTHALRHAGLTEGQAVYACSGLPVNRFYLGLHLNKELIKAKRANLKRNDVKAVDGSPVPVITRHEVVSEAIAAWFDIILRRVGGALQPDTDAAQMKTAIIDMGGRTVDIAVIQNYNLDTSRSSTIEVGMLNVQEKVQQLLESQFRSPLTVAQVNQAMNTGAVRMFGESRDVRDLVESAKADIVPSIRAEVKRRLGTAADIDQVVFAGGTAAALRDHLDGWYPHQTISDEPAFANARGMAKYAEYILGGND